MTLPNDYYLRKGALDDAFMNHQITDEYYLRELAQLEAQSNPHLVTDVIKHINNMRRKRQLKEEEK